jgi:hypothetical protein
MSEPRSELGGFTAPMERPANHPQGNRARLRATCAHWASSCDSVGLNAGVVTPRRRNEQDHAHERSPEGQGEEREHTCHEGYPREGRCSVTFRPRSPCSALRHPTARHLLRRPAEFGPSNRFAPCTAGPGLNHGASRVAHVRSRDSRGFPASSGRAPRRSGITSSPVASGLFAHPAQELRIQANSASGLSLGWHSPGV